MLSTDDLASVRRQLDALPRRRLGATARDLQPCLMCGQRIAPRDLYVRVMGRAVHLDCPVSKRISGTA